MWIKTIAAVASASIVLSGAAFAASDQSDVEMCLRAVNQATASEHNVDVRFKSLSGGRLQNIALEAKTGGEKHIVICRVKRGKVIALDWKGGAPAYASR